MADLNQFLAGGGKILAFESIINLVNVASYTVPTGKVLVPRNLSTSSGGNNMVVNGVDVGNSRLHDDAHNTTLAYTAGNTFAAVGGAAIVSISGFICTVEDL